MMPSRFGLVYVGTTLNDLSDVTHGWNEVSTGHRVFMALGFAVSVIMIVCITKVLDKDRLRLRMLKWRESLPHQCTQSWQILPWIFTTLS